jgi:hypothetical protein
MAARTRTFVAVFVAVDGRSDLPDARRCVGYPNEVAGTEQAETLVPLDVPDFAHQASHRRSQAEIQVCATEPDDGNHRGTEPDAQSREGSCSRDECLVKGGHARSIADF